MNSSEPGAAYANDQRQSLHNKSVRVVRVASLIGNPLVYLIAAEHSCVVFTALPTLLSHIVPVLLVIRRILGNTLRVVTV